VKAGNGVTGLGIKVGAWSAAIIGAATILGWLYSYLITQPVMAAVREERVARISSDSTLVARIEALSANQAMIAAMLSLSSQRNK
jgi:uncharacterized membrane protein